MGFLNIIQCGKCGTWIVIGEWQRNFGVCNNCSGKKFTVEELRPSMVKMHSHEIDYSKVNNLKEDFKELYHSCEEFGIRGLIRRMNK